MQTPNAEIFERMALMGFNLEDNRHLGDCNLFMMQESGPVTEEFLSKIADNPEVQAIVKDAETLERLKIHLKRYVGDLFSCVFDDNYLAKRVRIGQVHVDLGVSPKLYISAMCHLKSVIDRKIQANTVGEPDETVCRRRQDAMHKILMLDTMIVLETYIDCLNKKLTES